MDADASQNPLWLRRHCGTLAQVGVVFAAGFAAIGNLSDPLPHPYLAIGEIPILVMAPIMVCLMLAIHQCAPERGHRPSMQSTSSRGTCFSGWLSCSLYPRLRIGQMQRSYDGASFPADRSA